MSNSVTDRVRLLLQKYTQRPSGSGSTSSQNVAAMPQHSTENKPKNRKTKIVATIGPASESPAMLEELIQAGLNIARFNTKHNAPEWHADRMKRVRAAAEKLGVTIPLLLDLQGPEVRSVLVNQDSFPVEKGEVITFTSDAHTNQPKAVVVPMDVVQSLQVGKQILLEDGACEFVVVSKDNVSLQARAEYQCVIKSRKTINTPGTILNMPSLLPTDLAYLDACKDMNLEYVALSFVRDKKDVEILRSELQKRNMTTTQIIAKIENQAAIDHLDEVIAAADAIMVARGDLGVELPFYEVPHWQKIIIQKCRAANKFVITATQMLLSMVEKPRPTRAEVTDVATAVYDGTSAVMLSEESAMGKYPAKTVLTQAQIVAYHEQFV